MLSMKTSKIQIPAQKASNYPWRERERERERESIYNGFFKMTTTLYKKNKK